jgi:hypothetical protein
MMASFRSERWKHLQQMPDATIICSSPFGSGKIGSVMPMAGACEMLGMLVRRPGAGCGLHVSTAVWR